MTIEQANIRLKENEKYYFKPREYNFTVYAAVIKKSNDLDILDDYIIELGISNFDVEYDLSIFTAMSKNEISRSFNKVIADDYSNDFIQIIVTSKAKLQSRSLPKITGGACVFFEKGSLSYGTAGGFFKIKKDNSLYLISNRHVIVDNNEELKTNVVYPASIEAKPNGSEKIIGQVCWASNKNSEFMDAAIAKIDYPVEIGKYSMSTDIKYKSISEPKIFDNVKKYGHTTKVTYGEIRSINCTVNTSKSIEYTRLYRHQILTTLMSDDGDSGSLLVNDYDEVVGLIFAGNDDSASFANNACFVFNNSKNKFKVKNILKFV